MPAMTLTPEALERELANLGTLDLPELRDMFLELIGTPLPKFLRTGFVRRVVAHALRERADGGLDRETRRQLDDLVAQITPNGQAPLMRPNRKLRSGTRLVREWQGKVHEVAVTKDGYVWNGTTHQSLSKIASSITGTRWNGWVFFGVKKPAPPERDALPTPANSGAGRTRREAAHG
ncbi:DUF2924 domain-containing protein [Ancylobacter sp. Lp-2]|uniref:DUF2924 domain-containing protein n=1 Tax=Ancylobacter sp. Lp-2 TaxID=2881339 RepID=UPI001E342110|nr:DUF2924 domain-containing protein [Ancylobacter sp. Lp-2]MCB4767676.1 DUF2924 domain-containing protein [Ancylobacter sp. Lp-2]